ncbi:alpha/beta hydrolase [Roseobacter sp. A03A-229]
MSSSRLRSIIALCAVVLAFVSILRLETARERLSMTSHVFGDTPVTLYRAQAAEGALVVVSHGFAGSRQMMEAVSLTLARAGHTVVAFDYLGHGRHPGRLSPDITSLTGTTEDLVQQTLDVVAEARALTGMQAVSLVGHSMATDVVVRAAARLQDVESVVAISMYSEAVTPTHPERLLILSGAQESRLRAVALEAVAQVGLAAENETRVEGDIQRRAAVAPVVGHVGVLWSPVTLRETAAWIGGGAGPVRTGPWIAALLAALLALSWPLARLLPKVKRASPPTRTRAALAACLPAPLAVLASAIPMPVLGLSGFGPLALVFATWGVGALALLRLRPAIALGPAALGALCLGLWGLGVYGLAMDRYAAAFLPSGPRLPLMLALLPATLIFALADRAMVQGRHILLRVALRLPFLAALMAAMVWNVADIGMVFTVLPVFVLFLCVYGTMARWVEARTGPLGPMIGAGVILAWSIAASTPLFSSALP